MVGVIRPTGESNVAGTTMTSVFGTAELLVGDLVAVALTDGVRFVAAVFRDEAGALLRVGVLGRADEAAAAGRVVDGAFFAPADRARFAPEPDPVEPVDVSSAIASLLWCPRRHCPTPPRGPWPQTLLTAR
jgi:hypothetical protein